MLFWGCLYISAWGSKWRRSILITPHFSPKKLLSFPFYLGCRHFCTDWTGVVLRRFRLPARVFSLVFPSLLHIHMKRRRVGIHFTPFLSILLRSGKWRRVEAAFLNAGKRRRWCPSVPIKRCRIGASSLRCFNVCWETGTSRFWNIVSSWIETTSFQCSTVNVLYTTETTPRGGKSCQSSCQSFSFYFFLVSSLGGFNFEAMWALGHLLHLHFWVGSESGVVIICFLQLRRRRLWPNLFFTLSLIFIVAKQMGTFCFCSPFFLAFHPPLSWLFVH